MADAKNWRQLIVLAAAIGGIGMSLTFVPRSVIYEVETTFATVPETDDGLIQWLEDQPDMFRVFVRRVPGGQRWRITVTYGRSENSGGPPHPDLDRAARQLGYALPMGPFEHSYRN